MSKGSTPTPSFHYVFSNSNFPSSLEIDDACQKLRTMALSLFSEAQKVAAVPQQEVHGSHFTIPNVPFFDLYTHALDLLAFCFIYAGHSLRDVTIAFDAAQLPIYKQMISQENEKLVQDAFIHNMLGKNNRYIFTFLGLAYLHAVVCKLENNNKQEYEHTLRLLKEIVGHNFAKKKIPTSSPFKGNEILSEDEKTHIAVIRLANPHLSNDSAAATTTYSVPILKDWMNSDLKIKVQIMALRVWFSMLRTTQVEDFAREDEDAIKLLFEFNELDNYNPYMHHAKALFIHTVHRDELNHAIHHYFLAAPNYPVGDLQKVNAWATLGWVCELGHPTEKDFPHLYKFAKQALESYNTSYQQNVDYAQYVLDLKKAKLGKNVQRRLNKCFKCGAKAVHLKTCSACKWALYCSGECQKLDWVDHKQMCNKIKNKEAEVVTERIEGTVVYYLAEDWK